MLVSTIRTALRKYPVLFTAAKFFYSRYSLVRYVPIAVKHIKSDYKKLKDIRKDNASKPKAWFVCVPSHANLGDQAMAYSIREWIRKNYPEYVIVELTRESFKTPFRNISHLIQKNLGTADVFFVQGGYTSGDKTTNEPVHRLLAKVFRGNRIVFFPQTVYYTTEKEKKKTADLYNNHGRILFLARDEVSYFSVKDAFTNIDVRMWPDVVSSLVGRNQFATAKRTKDILMCIRNDSEKKYTAKEINDIKKQLELHGYQVDLFDLMRSENERDSDWYDQVIRETVYTMSNYRVVVTDRFHGILYGMLANTRLAVLDSIDFKVKEGARMFGGMFGNNIRYIADAKDAVNVVDELYANKESVKYDSRCADTYYDTLRFLIDAL